MSNRYCCICKSRSGSREDLTFHQIPKAETIRMQWITAIGRDVGKTSTVCSDHFPTKNFIYKKYKDAIRRCISADSVPRVQKYEHDFSKTSEQAENMSTSTFNRRNNVETVVENNDAPNVNYDISNDEHAVLRNILNNPTIIIFYRKKKSSEPLKSTPKIRSLRYIGDFTPEDFASPEIFNIISKYHRQSQQRYNRLRMKIQRLDQKVKTAKELLLKVKSMGYITEEALNFLQSGTGSTEDTLITCS